MSGGASAADTPLSPQVFLHPRAPRSFPCAEPQRLILPLRAAPELSTDSIGRGIGVP